MWPTPRSFVPDTINPRFPISADPSLIQPDEEGILWSLNVCQPSSPALRCDFGPARPVPASRIQVHRKPRRPAQKARFPHPFCKAIDPPSERHYHNSTDTSTELKRFSERRKRHFLLVLSDRGSGQAAPSKARCVLFNDSSIEASLSPLFLERKI